MRAQRKKVDAPSNAQSHLHNAESGTARLMKGQGGNTRRTQRGARVHERDSRTALQAPSANTHSGRSGAVDRPLVWDPHHVAHSEEHGNGLRSWSVGQTGGGFVHLSLLFLNDPRSPFRSRRDLPPGPNLHNRVQAGWGQGRVGQGSQEGATTARCPTPRDYPGHGIPPDV